MSEQSTSLSLRDLDVYSDKRRRYRLVSAASLDLSPGKLHLLIGPNGAGKTSLLRGICGILPTTGSIAYGEQELAPLAPHQRSHHLAYQPQRIASFNGLSVLDFVASSRGAQTPWLSGLSPDDYQRCSQALKRAGATHLEQRRAGTLSGGELARVYLASTLALGAQWLLLDEPVASSDVAVAREIYGLLASLSQTEGLGIIVVEHDLGLARSWADTVTLIAKGKLQAHDQAHQLFTSPELECAYNTRFEQRELAPHAWAVVAVGNEERR